MGEFSKIYKTDLTDRQMMEFWSNVRLTHRDRELTMEWPPMSDTDFVNWMRLPENHPWVVLFRGTPVGMLLMENIQGKTAHVHFLTLPCGTHRTVNRGISVLRGAGLYALGSTLWEHSITSYKFDTLIGVTPASNRRALHFIHTIGATDCGVIPGYCWSYDTKENVPGVVTVYTRESVPAWTAKL